MCANESGIDTGPARERFTTELCITLKRRQTRLQTQARPPHGGPADPVSNAEISGQVPGT